VRRKDALRAFRIRLQSMVFTLFSDAAQEKFWLHWQSAEHTEQRDVANLTQT